MKLSFTSQDVDKIPVELLVLMHYEGDVPLKDMLGMIDWRVNGRLSRTIASKKYKGKARELLLMPSENRFKANEVILLGLGEKAQFSEDHISQVIDYFLQTVEKKKTRQVCFSLNSILPSQFEWRNAVRLLLSKLVDCKSLDEVVLREPVELIRDAKKRQIQFGPQVKVEYQ